MSTSATGRDLMTAERDSRWDPRAMRDLARLELAPEELEDALVRALAQGQMVAMFQPQVHLPGLGLRGFEVLVRWRHPRFGLLRPQRFIRLAEHCEAAVELDLFALREAERLAEALGAGADGLSISVNASPRAAARAAYADRVAALARRLGESGIALVAEITERSPLLAWRRTLRNLRKIRQAGARVAVDDFGSGYASFGIVRRLELNEIKIDRSLLRDPDPEAAAILTAILEMARAIGVEVVAEGVENEAQHRLLVALGCPLAQGYFYGHPLPLADAAGLAREAAAASRGRRRSPCA